MDDIRNLLRLLEGMGSIGMLALTLFWLFPRIIQQQTKAEDRFLRALEENRKEHQDMMSKFRKEVEEQHGAISRNLDANTRAIQNLTIGFMGLPRNRSEPVDQK